MSELSEIAEDILCSIAVIPCTLEELIERDFLKNRWSRSIFSLDIIKYETKIYVT